MSQFVCKIIHSCFPHDGKSTLFIAIIIFVLAFYLQKKIALSLLAS